MKSPAELLAHLAQRAMFRGSQCVRPYEASGTPGEFIQRLPEEQRATLRELRSEDTASPNERPYMLARGVTSEANGWWDSQVRPMLLEFDRKKLRMR